MAKRGQGKSRHKGKGTFGSEGGTKDIQEKFESQSIDDPQFENVAPGQIEDEQISDRQNGLISDDRDPLSLPEQIKIVSIDGKKFVVIDDSPDDLWDVSSLPISDELQRTLVKAIALVLAQMDRGKSRRSKYNDLMYGYVQFLIDSRNELESVHDIDKAHIHSFVDWLSSATSRRTKKPLTKGNRIHKLGTARDVLEKVSRQHPDLKIKEIFPSNAFAKQESDDKNKTKALENEIFRSLILHVESELILLIDSIGMHLPKVTPAAGGATAMRGTQGSEAYRAAGRMIDRFGFVPRINEVVSFTLEEKSEGNLSRGVRPRDVLLCCGPTAKQLYMFFLYILIYTAFNEQPIRDTELGDIETFELGGFLHTIFRNEKRRAGSAVRRKFTEDINAKLSIARVVEVLKRWTAPIRRIAHRDVQQKLFLYTTKNRSSERSVASFASAKYDRSADSIMRNNASNVSRLLKGRFIGTRAIRVASAELLHDAFNGDLVLLSLALAHSSTITTDHHYRTEAARDADERRLAAAMQLRERYLESNGVVDPRDSRSISEVSGATPGWGCMDNLDSPILDQVKGRPCKAYPMCPACPLGVPLVEDKPYVLARTVQLFGKIEELAEVIGPKRTAARYGKLLTHLGLYHERLSADKECEATAALLVLNPLPDLE